MLEVHAAHHDVLLLLFQFTLLLAMARLLGEVALRLGQPSVVGEIVAGIVLAPSLLGAVAPSVNEWFTLGSGNHAAFLETVRVLGGIFLLLVTGMEINLTIIRQHIKNALGAAAGGLVLPLIAGFLLGMLLPSFLLVDPEKRVVFALFIATALSISAIPVIAKILLDMRLLDSVVGQTILAAAMLDDLVGWSLLSIVSGMAVGEEVGAAGVLQVIGTVGILAVASATIGRWTVAQAFTLVAERGRSQDRLLTLVVVFAFAGATVTHVAGLEALLGAFVIGILFGQLPKMPREVHHRLESIALGIFAPIFFAMAGRHVNLLILAASQLLWIILLVIAVATFSKIVGAYLGARLLAQSPHWQALSFGAGLNARGAMGIIVGSIGFSTGILTQEMYSIIVLLAIATSIMTPATLRWALGSNPTRSPQIVRAP